MFVRLAVLEDGGGVFGGPVAFVFGKSVGGVEGVEFEHEAVAGDFGDDRGQGDSEAFFVAGNNAFVFVVKGFDGRSIDENAEGGTGSEPFCSVVVVKIGIDLGFEAEGFGEFASKNV